MNGYGNGKGDDDGELLLTPYIPFPLDIPNRPELSVFPRDVMFSRSAKCREGTKYFTAVYEPILETFHDEPDNAMMLYRSRSDPRFWLGITYHKADGSYSGARYEHEQRRSAARGQNWRIFFTHLSLAGVFKGERVFIETIGPVAEPND